MVKISRPPFHKTGVIKSIVSHAKPGEEKRNVGVIGKPPRKKAKVEAINVHSDVVPVHETPSTPISSSTPLDLDSDSEDDSFDIPTAIGMVLHLLKSPGTKNISVIKSQLIKIKKQAQVQYQAMEKLKEDADEAKLLAKAREEQMDKMSNYMWPAQLVDMWTDDRYELIKDDMRKDWVKADAKFDKDLKAGLAEMPEKPQLVMPKGPQKMAVWPENEKGEVVKDMSTWWNAPQRPAVGRGRWREE